MRAIITGGAGFVGTHLAAHLEAHGDTPIILDRVQGLDIRDRDDVLAKFEAANADAVYHLAAFTHVGDSWTAPVDVIRINVEGTLNVLDAARMTGVQRVLVIGSSEEYGKVSAADMPLSESTPLRPTTPYGASKAAAGLLAQQAWYGHGLETVRVRPFNHTGAGQPPAFVAPAMAQRIVAAQRNDIDHIMVGNLSPIRELLDVRDVVRAYRLLLERGEPGEVYNVSTGTGHSIETIARTLVSFADRDLELRVDPELVRPVDLPKLVGDASKIAAHCGWVPEYAITETLRAVYEYAAHAASIHTN